MGGRKIEMYHLGRIFYVITDDKAITWIKEKEEFGNKRMQRRLIDCKNMILLLNIEREKRWEKRMDYRENTEMRMKMR